MTARQYEDYFFPFRKIFAIQLELDFLKRIMDFDWKIYKGLNKKKI